MTLSNFDWTDKDSVKWFMMLPTGHVGPYSLNQLLREKSDGTISGNVKIWAEGLETPVELDYALTYGEEIPDLPDLPPLPPEDDVPPIPLPLQGETPLSDFPPLEIERLVEEDVPEEIPSEEEVIPVKKFPIKKVAALGIVLTLGPILYFLIRSAEKFDISRYPKMTVALHERILRENEFDGWGKKIFFKEYLPDDHTHIWLVTSSFQRCDVEATFQSLKDKTFSVIDEKISFKTRGELKNHVVEFSSFDFMNGNKIIPGLYEMEVHARNCKWDGPIALVMNGFSGPDSSYDARTKVVLYSKGPAEFSQILNKLTKKKMEEAKKEANQTEAFWQDLQQKLETLNAISLQIEQHLLDFLDIPPGPPGSFTKNLKVMVDQYTKQYGSFLTSFVVENENYFKGLNQSSKGASERRNYELMVKLLSKRIGLETMKFIEEFQGIKKAPNKEQLEKYSNRVKTVFSGIKTDIGQKLHRISEDRGK